MFSPDGKRVAFAAASDLWIAPLDDPRQTAFRVTKDDEFVEMMPSFSPDSSSLVFVRARNNRGVLAGALWIEYDIWTCLTDGEYPEQLTHARFGEASRPYFTKDGHAVLFAASVASRAGSVIQHGLWSVPETGDNSPVHFSGLQRVLDLNNPSTPSQFSDPYARLFDPAPSQDRQKVTFVSDADEPYRYDVWAIPATSEVSFARSKAQPLGCVTKLEQAAYPTFSPDNRSIYFISRGDTMARLMRIDTKGEHPPQKVCGF